MDKWVIAVTIALAVLWLEIELSIPHLASQAYAGLLNSVLPQNSMGYQVAVRATEILFGYLALPGIGFYSGYHLEANISRIFK